MSINIKELRRLLAEASVPATGRKRYAESDYARALHGAAPALLDAAEEAERLRADLATLRAEHEAWGVIIDATRTARDEAQAECFTTRTSLYASQSAWLEADNRVRVLEPEVRLLRDERDAARSEVATLRAALDDSQRAFAVALDHVQTQRDEARAELDKADARAFIRGLFWALATHADATGQEEGIATTDIRTIAEAIAAGAEEQDARKLMKRLTAVRERERAAAKAAKEQG